MKKNLPLLIVASLGIAHLIHQYDDGLNYFLVTLIVLFTLSVQKQHLLRDKTWWLLMCMAFVSSLGILVVNTKTAFLCTFSMWFALGGYAISPKYSLLAGWYNGLLSPFKLLVTLIRLEMQDLGKVKSNRLFTWLVSLLVGLLFFFVYAGSNLIVGEWVRLFFGEVFTPSLVFVMCIVLLFLCAFTFTDPIARLLAYDQNAKSQFEPSGTLSEARISMIQNMFWVVNAVILVFNGIDLFYLHFEGHMPEGVHYHEYVHQGVYGLIFSIVMAISLIVYSFGPAMANHPEIGKCRRLAYAWVVQNILLVLLTTEKNSIYMLEFGLTEKRIGVFVYLLFCLVGLYLPT